MKRIIASLLVLCLTFSLFPVTAFAEEVETSVPSTTESSEQNTEETTETPVSPAETTAPPVETETPPTETKGNSDADNTAKKPAAPAAAPVPTECDHWYAWEHDVAANKCYKKCTKCGDTKEKGEIWFVWLDDGNGNHYKHCTHCNNGAFDKEHGEHWFAWKHDEATNKCYKECSTCGMRKEVGDIWYAWFEDENGNHYKHCTHCNNGAFDKEHGEHVFDGFWNLDDNDHWDECEVCGMQKDRAAHDFGEETVIPYDETVNPGFGRKVKICNTCGYQLLIEDNVPVAESAADSADCKHWYAWEHDVAANKCRFKCDLCGDVKKESDINFIWLNDGNGNHYKHCTHCNNSNFDKEHGKHDYDGFWDLDEKDHWDECKVCGLQKDREAHDFYYEVGAVPGVHIYKCATCGWEKERAEHDFWWGQDPEDPNAGHFHKCSVCGFQQDYDEHDFYYEVGAVPGVHIKKCSVCGWEKERAEHDFWWGQDPEDPNAGHFHKCSVCGFQQDYDEHDFYYEVGAVPGVHIKKCSVCGWEKERAEHDFWWGQDPEDPNAGHFHKCSVCGFQQDYAEHDFYYEVGAVPGVHIKKCSICGWEKERGEHVYDGFWNLDENDHWEECEVCGLQKDRVAHEFGEEVVIPYDESFNPGFGRKVKICDICGYQLLIEDNVPIVEITNPMGYALDSFNVRLSCGAHEAMNFGYAHAPYHGITTEWEKGSETATVTITAATFGRFLDSFNATYPGHEFEAGYGNDLTYELTWNGTGWTGLPAIGVQLVCAEITNPMGYALDNFNVRLSCGAHEAMEFGFAAAPYHGITTEWEKGSETATVTVTAGTFSRFLEEYNKKNPGHEFAAGYGNDLTYELTWNGTGWTGLPAIGVQLVCAEITNPMGYALDNFNVKLFCNEHEAMEFGFAAAPYHGIVTEWEKGSETATVTVTAGTFSRFLEEYNKKNPGHEFAAGYGNDLTYELTWDGTAWTGLPNIGVQLVCETPVVIPNPKGYALDNFNVKLFCDKHDAMHFDYTNAPYRGIVVDWEKGSETATVTVTGRTFGRFLEKYNKTNPGHKFAAGYGNDLTYELTWDGTEWTGLPNIGVKLVCKSQHKWSTNPKTSDDSNIYLWVTVLSVSAVALVGASVYGLKKKKHN